MKPFNLEAAKRGEPIVTRDGRKARFVAYIPEAKEGFKVIAYIEGGMSTLSYFDDGFYAQNAKDMTDLFMYTPPMRSINGYEYPEPVREPLEVGQEYWVANHVDQYMVCERFVWDGGKVDMLRLKRGLIQLTREGAVAQAKAVILAGGGEV